MKLKHSPLHCIRLAFIGLSAAALSSHSAHAADQTWDAGAGTQNWDDAINWTGNAFPTTNAFIDTSTGLFPIITATPSWVGTDIKLGNGGSLAGRVDQRGGTVTTGNGNWVFIQNGSSANSVYNLADTSITGQSNLTTFGQGTGSLTVGGTSTTSGRLNLGVGSSGTGTFNMNTSGTLTTKDTTIGILLGTNGGKAIFNLDSGTVNTGNVWLGDNNASSTGILNIAGGAFNSTFMNVGNKLGQGTINLSGGTLTNTGEIRVGTTDANGVYAGTSGMINVSGSGSAVLGALTVGRGNNNQFQGTGTVNVSSGSMTLSSGLLIVGYNGDGTGGGALNITGSGTFNANGVSGSNGTLIGTANSGKGSVVVNGATAAFTSVNDIVIADNNSSTGSLTLTSGTVNLGTSNTKWMKLNSGSSGNASVTINGGTMNLNTNSAIRFTTATGATGTNSFTLNDGLVQGQTGNQNGVASLTSVLDMNQAATGAANNTFNLNGGTLLIGQVLSNQVNNAGGSRIFNFNGGTLKAAGNNAAFFNLGAGTGTARANVRDNGAIIDTNTFDVTVAQALLQSNVGGDAGTGGLTKSGTGTLGLSNSGNTFSGGLTINNGTVLQTAGAGTLGTGTVILGDGLTANNATLTGNVGLNTTNTNAITIASGGTGTYTIKNTSGSDYSFSGAIALNNAATFQTTAGGAMFLQGTITGSSLITIDGGGTTTKFVRLDADNSSSFTGNLSVTNKGTLKFNIDNGTGTATAATLDATSTIDGGGKSMTFAGVNGVTGSVVLNNGTGLTLGGSGTYDLAGSIQNGGTLTKSGAGTQTLSGTNTYTGATNVNAGKLVVGVGGVGSITSNVGVSSAAILGGSGTITGNVTLAAESGAGLKNGGTLAPGNSPGTLTVTASTTFSTGSIFEWDINSSLDQADTDAGTGFDSVKTASLSGPDASVFKVVLADGDTFASNFWDSAHDWTNIFSTDGTTANALNIASIFSSFSGTGVASDGMVSGQGLFTFTGGGSTLTWSAVPEPTSALAGLLIGAGLLRRRRKH